MTWKKWKVEILQNKLLKIVKANYTYPGKKYVGVMGLQANKTCCSKKWKFLRIFFFFFFYTLTNVWIELQGQKCSKSLWKVAEHLNWVELLTFMYVHDTIWCYIQEKM